MEIEDVSNYSHGERSNHYFASMFGPVKPTTTMEEYQSAQNMATAEMLDEIHVMLRELLKVSKPVDK